MVKDIPTPDMTSKRIKNVLLVGLRWHTGLMLELANEAEQRGWHINLDASLTGDVHTNWGGSGIIVTANRNEPAIVRLLERTRHKCPTVGLLCGDIFRDIPKVLPDDKAMGELSATYFMARNFRSFACYERLHTDALPPQFDAFKRYLEGHGHPVHRINKDTMQLEAVWRNRIKQLSDALTQLPQPLAVFAEMDSTAVELIDACQLGGLSIPDQIAILGTYDMPLYRHSAITPLSSISIDIGLAVKTACDMLDRMMDGESVDNATIRIPPTGVITRRSTDTIAASDPQVASVIRFMLDNYATPIDLPILVQQAHMSKSRLYDVFQQDLGKPPLTILTQIRVENAKKLLRETNQKVLAISESCGFGEVANFYNHFKKHTGMTPTEYRKRHHANPTLLSTAFSPPTGS
jgi:LacI family transcriptional regulator